MLKTLVLSIPEIMNIMLDFLFIHKIMNCEIDYKSEVIRPLYSNII